MSESPTETIHIDDVQALIGDGGYEVTREDPEVLKVKDLDSGIVLRVILEDNIAYCTVNCMSTSSDRLGPEVLRSMLAADNGISTSHFQLYERGEGTTAITLNNFCKLQTLGDDDRDDLLSCLEFLIVDVCMARELLGDLAD